eukprot:SAG22_NODE_181_length_16048_cov_157.464418_22_plen_240_part_00
MLQSRQTTHRHRLGRGPLHPPLHVRLEHGRRHLADGRVDRRPAAAVVPRAAAGVRGARAAARQQPGRAEPHGKALSEIERQRKHSRKAVPYYSRAPDPEDCDDAVREPLFKDRQTTRKGTVLDRKTAGAQQKDSALLLTFPRFEQRLGRAVAFGLQAEVGHGAELPEQPLQAVGVQRADRPPDVVGEHVAQHQAARRQLDAELVAAGPIGRQLGEPAERLATSGPAARQVVQQLAVSNP